MEIEAANGRRTSWKGCISLLRPSLPPNLSSQSRGLYSRYSVLHVPRWSLCQHRIFVNILQDCSDISDSSSSASPWGGVPRAALSSKELNCTAVNTVSPNNDRCSFIYFSNLSRCVLAPLLTGSAIDLSLSSDECNLLSSGRVLWINAQTAVQICPLDAGATQERRSRT